MSEKKIPFCYDSKGKVISHKDIVDGRDYTCIFCGGKLIVRDGDIRDKHLAHLCGNDTCVSDKNYKPPIEHKFIEKKKTVVLKVDLKYEDMPPLVQQQIDLGLLTMADIEAHLKEHIARKSN